MKLTKKKFSSLDVVSVVKLLHVLVNKDRTAFEYFFNFQKKDGEWHEILVDIKEGGGLRFIMSRGPTTNSKAFLTVSYIAGLFFLTLFSFRY